MNIMVIKFFGKFLIAYFLALFFVPAFSLAQEIVPDKVEILRAEVLEVLNETKGNIPGTDIEHSSQTISVRIIEGERNGEVVEMENDYVALEAGDKFFLYHSVDIFSGREVYAVKDVDRLSVILFFIGLFIVVVLIFSGAQGLRSLLALFGSFFVILYVLIPGLLAGYPPVATSILVSIVILFLAIYLSHGFSRTTTVAFLGTTVAVCMTGVLAYAGVGLARLSGLISEEAFYLNLSTQGALDFTGLLLGGMMIGVLGVLDDIAVTQVAVVREIYDSASHLSRTDVYKKALSVGRDHIGALINTLALAYTGAALPILLLFQFSDTSIGNIINQEIFATEIIRTVVGSIGLILTVPITTLLAVYVLHTKQSA